MDAVEDAFAIHRRGNYVMPDRITVSRGQNMMLYMPCLLDQTIGTKMLSEFPENPGQGLPYLSGLMILNDGKTGAPQAILDGSALTAMRTGAVGGVALRYLAPAGSRRVGLVGCGVQGLHQLLYACAVCDVEEIFLYSRSLNYTSFIRQLGTRLKRPDIKIIPCESSRQLAEHSDILISATQAIEPVYPDDPELLQGKCFVAIGSWQPNQREVPDAVCRLADYVYTELPYACEETGDLCIPLASGALDRRKVCYMEDLIAETKAGCSRPLGGTRYFKSVGMGLFDVCVARMVWKNAVQKGLGKEIEW